MSQQEKPDEKLSPLNDKDISDYMLFKKWRERMTLRTQLDLYNNIALHINHKDFTYTRRSGFLM